MSYKLPRIDPEAVSKEYDEAATLLRTSQFIESSPVSTRPIGDLFTMAIRREPPFEQSEDGVVGFQDAVILFSVIDHLISTGKPPSAFVSSDKVFGKCRTLIDANDLDLQIFDGLKEILIRFMAEVNQQVKEWWQRDKEEARQAFETARKNVEDFIFVMLTPSDLGRTWQGSIVSIEAVEATKIGSVDTPILDDLLKKTLFREDGASVKCTAQIEVTFQVTVEVGGGDLFTVFNNLVASRVGGQPRETPPIRHEKDSAHRIVEVDADAVYKRGIYTITRLNAVRSKGFESKTLF